MRTSCYSHYDIKEIERPWMAVYEAKQLKYNNKRTMHNIILLCRIRIFNNVSMVLINCEVTPSRIYLYIFYIYIQTFVVLKLDRRSFCLWTKVNRKKTWYNYYYLYGLLNVGTDKFKCTILHPYWEGPRWNM